MSAELYKQNMTQHFKNRLRKRVGITINKGQRKDIIDSIHGKGSFKVSFEGGTGNSNRAWYLVQFLGEPIYVLYDKKYNKLVTCLSYEDKPIESLRNDLLQADKQLALKLYEVDKLREHIVELQAEIKEREDERK
jgi:uncharacterized small protein (DUF1192 family)